MTEDATTPEAPANQQATAEAEAQQSQAEANLTIKHRKEEFDLPKDEVVRLAQKGFDYETKTKELGEQRRQMEEQAAEFDQMRQFKSYLDANPDKAAKIAAVIEGEEYGLGDDVDPESTEFLQAKKLKGLESQLQNLTDDARQAEIRRIQADVDRNISNVISSSEVLQRSDDLARQAILQELASDPSQEIAVAAKVVESKFARVASAKTPEEYVESKKEQSRFAVESGGSPAAATSTGQAFNKGSMQDGSLRSAALEYLKGVAD